MKNVGLREVHGDVGVGVRGGDVLKDKRFAVGLELVSIGEG